MRGYRVARGTAFMALVLAVLGSLWWGLRVPDVADEPAPPPPAPAPPVEVASPEPDPGQWPSSALLDGAEVDPPLGGPGHVRGRLVWRGTGLPIHWATVLAVRAWPDTVVANEVEEAAPGRVPRRLAELIRGRPDATDAEGRFEVRDIPQVDGPMGLVAFLMDGTCLEATPLQPGPAPGAVIELGTWEISPRGTLTGKVCDPDGRPRADVRVRFVDVPFEADPAFHPLARAARLWGARHCQPGSLVLTSDGVVEIGPADAGRDALLPFPETRTDARGSFTLAQARPGAGLLVVQAPGQPGHAQQVIVRAGALIDVGTIALPAGELRGTLRSHAQPVAGAEVSVLPEGTVWMQSPAVAGPDGQFVLPGFAGTPAWAAVRRPGAKVWELVQVQDAPDRCVIEVPPESRLRLHVVDAKEEAVRGARVETRYATSQGGTFGQVGSVLREAQSPGVYEGRYEGRYEGVDFDGQSIFVARVPGVAPQVDLLWGPFRCVSCTEPLFTATFSVHNAAGRPVEGATVFARFVPRGQQSDSWTRPYADDLFARLRRGFVRLGATDASGRLRCEGFWTCALDCVAAHPDIGIAERRFRMRPDAPSLTLALGPATHGRLVGRLRENGQVPRRRWLVVVWCWARREWRLAVSEPDGTFAFTLSPGEWHCFIDVRVGPPGAEGVTAEVKRLQAERGWPFAAAAPIEVRAGDEHHVDLEVRRWIEDLGPPLRAGAVRVDGAAAAGLTVREVFSPEGEARVPEMLDAMRARLHGDAAFLPRHLARLGEADAWTRLMLWMDRLDLKEAMDPRDHEAHSTLAALKWLDQGFDLPTWSRWIDVMSVGSVAETDADGRFRFDALRSRASWFEVVRVDAGVEQRLWRGPLADGQRIGIRTGHGLFEVRDARGLLVCNRMFVAYGRGTAAEACLVGATDRSGLLDLPGAPLGEYDLRLRAGGIEATFASPAFVVRGPASVPTAVAAR